MTDRDLAAAEATCAAAGGDATAYEADASYQDAVPATIEAAADALGGLDGLVLNVGVAGGLRLEGTTADDWDLV